MCAAGAQVVSNSWLNRFKPTFQIQPARQFSFSKKARSQPEEIHPPSNLEVIIANKLLELENRINDLERQIIEMEMDYYPPQPLFQHANVQSLQLEDAQAPPTTEVHEVVGFQDEMLGEEVAMSTFVDDTRDVNKTENTELANFLARPVLIDSSTWAVGTTYSRSINVWSAWLSNAQVRKKIDNYAYFRGNLKIKLIINASPFYYGCAIAAYRPLVSFTNDFTPDSTARIQLSQQPHIWLYPQHNSGGEMELPFFYYKDWLDITTASEVVDMGRLDLLSYVNLTSANGATSTGVTVQVFAWCEDPVLSAPTAMLSLQSKDEYGNGPVSRPSAIVANVASKLTKVPVIGPFAKATEIGASAISSIARLFGFSNPPVIENPKPVVLNNLPNLSSAEISHPNHRFTLDPKAELTVDPRITGVDLGDEMVISDLVQKESFLTQINWSTSQAYNTQLYAMAVTPDVKGVVAGSRSRQLNLPPMCWAFAPFSAWRGDIRVRIKVICSKYHKGRLAFTYDPKADLATNGLSVTMNTSYTRILDIAESDEMVIDIPYLQEAPFIDSGALTASTNQQVSAFTNMASDLNNGTFTIRVMNNLSAPVDTSTVTIQVFVSGGSNMVFANPVDIGNFTYANLQSKVVETETLVETSDTDSRFLVNYNEPVGSIRKLLRRFQYLDTTSVFAATSTNMALTIAQNRMPPDGGYFTNGNITMNGTNVPASSFAGSGSAPILLNWFKPAYVAHRGSTKWLYNAQSGGSAFIPLNYEVRRVDDNNTSSGAVAYPGTVAGSLAYQNSRRYTPGTGGSLINNEKSGSGLSFEHNMYNHFRFASNKVAFKQTTDFDGNLNDNHIVTARGFQSSTYTTNVDRYVAIGTDFSLHFFLCVPTVYYYTTQPTVTAGNTYSI